MELKVVKKIIFSISVILILLGGADTVLRIALGGPPPLEHIDTDDFYYHYVEIYKRFYRKSGSNYISNASRLEREEFPVKKPANTKRVFIAGGSVAESFGWTKSEFEERLKRVIPAYDFEVINAGRGSYPINAVYNMFSEIKNYDPDLIILLAGNNARDPRYWNMPDFLKVPLFYSINKLFRRLWLYRLPMKMHKELRSSLSRSEKNTEYDEQTLRTMVNNRFRKYVELMSEECAREKIPFAVCTLPQNLSDYPDYYKKAPYYNPYFLHGMLAYEKGDYEHALALFSNSKGMENNPFTLYYEAKIYEKQGKYEKAKNTLIESVDIDQYPPVRCPRSFNEIIRDISSKSPSILVDLEKRFFDSVPNSVLGFNIFLDNCHWRHPSDKIVMDEVMQSIYIHNKTSVTPVLAGDANWETSRLGVNMSYILEKNRKQLEDEIEYYLRLAILECVKNQLEEAITDFRLVYKHAPDLLGSGTITIERVEKIFMDNTWTRDFIDEIRSKWYLIPAALGEAYRREGLYDRAERTLREAVIAEPDCEEARLFLFLCFYLEGKTEPARESLKELKRLDSSFGYLEDRL